VLVLGGLDAPSQLVGRLEERCPALRIEKTGRGRFRFHVLRPVSLAEVPR